MLVNVEIENPVIKSLLFLKTAKIKRGRGSINNAPNIRVIKSFLKKNVRL